MKIRKRSGEEKEFEISKIERAMKKAFISVGKPIDEEKIKEMAKSVEEKIHNNFPKGHEINVEEIQDLVEITLLENNYYTVVKSYILYRASHHMMRKTIEDFSDYFTDLNIIEIMKNIQEDYKEDAYNLSFLYSKFSSFAKENMNEEEYLNILIKAASELTSKEAPKWEFIAARFLSYKIKMSIESITNRLEIFTFRDKTPNIFIGRN